MSWQDYSPRLLSLCGVLPPSPHAMGSATSGAFEGSLAGSELELELAIFETRESNAALQFKGAMESR